MRVKLTLEILDPRLTPVEFQRYLGILQDTIKYEMNPWAAKWIRQELRWKGQHVGELEIDP